MIQERLKNLILDQTTNTKFRLIYSDTLSAAMNMATDEALFASFDEKSLPIFRVYDWEKSFTIGISQDFSKFPNTNKFEEYNRNYSKRITGGGILFHGHDVSYSLLIPNSYMSGLNVKQSYEKICTFLLEFYKSLGLEAMYVKDDKNTTLSKSEFCQIGFEAYDILVNGKKIGGNAQRRTKNFIFQHGSIPLRAVKDKKEAGYSLEQLEICLQNSEAKDRMINSFAKTFNVDFEQSILNKKEKEKLEHLIINKYDKGQI